MKITPAPELVVKKSGRVWTEEDFPDYPTELLEGRKLSQTAYKLFVKRLLGQEVGLQQTDDLVLRLEGYRDWKDFAFQKALMAAAGPDLRRGEKGVWMAKDFPAYESDMVQANSIMSRASYKYFVSTLIGREVQPQWLPDEEILTSECHSWKDHLLVEALSTWEL